MRCLSSKTSPWGTQIHSASGREGSKICQRAKQIPPKLKLQQGNSAQPHLQPQTSLKGSSQLITASASWLCWKWKLLELFTDTLIQLDYEGVENQAHIPFNARTASAEQHSSANHIKIVFMLLPSAFVISENSFFPLNFRTLPVGSKSWVLLQRSTFCFLSAGDSLLRMLPCLGHRKKAQNPHPRAHRSSHKPHPALPAHQKFRLKRRHRVGLKNLSPGWIERGKWSPLQSLGADPKFQEQSW